MKMLKEALTVLTGETEDSAALRKLLPRGAVGMKTNCLTGKLNSTPVALVEALSGILEDAGWDANNIVVWERTNRELQKAGFKLNASSFGRRCLGTDANGVGYSARFYSAGESSSLVSRILEKVVAGNINMPVLKDHSIAGLSGGLKNMFGAINNPNKFHDNNGDPHVAEVSMMSPIRLKSRLTVMDAVQVQYHNGPGYDQRFLVRYGAVILSDDPVAADQVGLEIVEWLRNKGGLPNLAEAGRPATYLQTAEKLGLGVATMSDIDLKVLVVDDKGRVRPGELL
ncbi:MAG: DUF362 domain-containing protein [candidate division Zixibacteria bacterium]|nr:DUF362 domain-containing protein [candidate division Zixibacteria bacterium]